MSARLIKTSDLVTAGDGVNYFVSSTGNDANDGLSVAAAWASISKVNASTFRPGDSILFEGGHTFSGAIVAPSAGTPSRPITFGSYGSGKATISSGASSGFTSTNLPGVITRDLIYTGSASTNNGIKFDNNLAGNAHLPGIGAINCDVSGYGREGIVIEGSSGTAGYDDFVIFGNTVDSCCTVSNSGKGTAGIRVVSQTGYGSGSTAPSHTNGIVAGNKVTNCLGTTDTNWTGSGIVVSQARNCPVYGNIADGNGGGCLSANGGPVAIWAYDSVNVDIHDNQATNNSSGNNKDGGGFGLDGGCSNCSLRDNRSRNNKGAGYMVYTYNDGTVTTNDRSTVVGNFSEGDGSGGSSADAPTGLLLAAGTSGIMTNARVFGNTVYQYVANSHAIMIGGDPAAAAAITGIIGDNHVVQTGGADLVNVISNATSVVFQGNKYASTVGATFVWNGTTYTEISTFSAGTGNETAKTQATVLRTGDLTITTNNTNGTGFNLINTSTGGKSLSVFLAGSANGYGAGVLGWYNNTDDRAIWAYYPSTKQMAYEVATILTWGADQYALGRDTGIGRNAAGVIEINDGTPGTLRDLKIRDALLHPSTSIAPSANGDLVIQATSNTSLTFKLKGSDGTVRSGSLTLA